MDRVQKPSNSESLFGHLQFWQRVYLIVLGYDVGLDTQRSDRSFAECSLNVGRSNCHTFHYFSVKYPVWISAWVPTMLRGTSLELVSSINFTLLNFISRKPCSWNRMVKYTVKQTIYIVITSTLCDLRFSDAAGVFLPSSDTCLIWRSSIVADILRKFFHMMRGKFLQIYGNISLAFHFPTLSHVCSGVEAASLKIKILCIYIEVPKKMCTHFNLTKYLLSVPIDSTLKTSLNSLY
jgi:hypothetical protein